MEEVNSLPCGACCRAYGVSCCDRSKAILISSFTSFFHVNNLLASIIFCKLHKRWCKCGSRNGPINLSVAPHSRGSVEVQWEGRDLCHYLCEASYTLHPRGLALWGWHMQGCPFLFFVREGAKNREISHSSWPRHCAGTWSCFPPVPCSSPEHLSSQLWLCLSREVFLLLSQWASLPLVLY